MGKGSKLIKIGRKDVKSALGFFWHDRHKLYVAQTPEDVEEWKRRGYGELHPMSELEQAFKDSEALRFISWCRLGGIVRQGAHRVTFEYTTHRSVIHIK
jgi:hypothetical protein